MGFSKDLTIAGEPEDGAGLVGLYSPTSPTLWEIHPEGGPDRFRCVNLSPDRPTSVHDMIAASTYEIPL
jgi:hypothetical protein